MVAPVANDENPGRRRKPVRWWRPWRPHRDRPHPRPADDPGPRTLRERAAAIAVGTLAELLGAAMVFGCFGLPLYALYRGVLAVWADVFG